MAESAINLTRQKATNVSIFEDLQPLLLALAFIAVALAVMNGLLNSLGDSPQFSFTLAGSFVLYLATRPVWRELTITLALALTLRLAYNTSYTVQPYFGSAVIAFAGFLGVSSLVVLAYSALRQKRLSNFATAAFFPFFSIMAGFVLPLTNRLTPATFDTHLLAADGTLGFEPSFFLGRLIFEHTLLWNLTSTIYYSLPLAVALLCTAHIGKRPEEVRRLLWLFGLMSATGFCIYLVCPATGPIYAFRGSFPLSPPALSTLSLTTLPATGAPRNAMPSLHFSTALLVLWNSRPLRSNSHFAAMIFLAATAFAILALGEHYVTDMVVALPFSLFFQAAFENRANSRLRSNSRLRYGVMLGSAGLVALWLLLLRYSVQWLIIWPRFTQVAFVSTVGVSFWCAGKLGKPTWS